MLWLDLRRWNIQEFGTDNNARVEDNPQIILPQEWTLRFLGSGHGFALFG